MEQPEFQPKAGMYCKTEDGRRAFIQGEKHPFDTHPDNWPLYGFIEGGELSEVTWWGPDGKSVDGDGDSLLAEWVEPKRVQGWIAMTEILSVGMEPTRELALKRFKTAFGSDATICIEIDVLEGQGLEGGR